MNFKFNGNVFKNTAEDHARIYGENYDASKNYPGFTGTIEIPKSQLQEFVTYLHYACQTQLKHSDYLNDDVVPVKMSGWAKMGGALKGWSVNRMKEHFKFTIRFRSHGDHTTHT